MTIIVVFLGGERGCKDGGWVREEGETGEYAVHEEQIKVLFLKMQTMILHLIPRLSLS